MAVLTFYLGKKLHLDFRPVAGLGQVQLEIAGLDALLAMKGDASHQNDHGTVPRSGLCGYKNAGLLTLKGECISPAWV